MSSRLNYYFRQKVTEAELDLGFALLEAADHTTTTDLGLVGVITGMVVTQRGAGANLTVDVSAGKANDKDGFRISTTSPQNVDLSVDESAVSTAVVDVGNTKIVSLFAKFTRILSDPRTDGNSVTVYFSEAEGFAFVVRQGVEGVSPSPVGVDGSFILLADVTRAQGATTIVNANISTARREDCFVHAGSPNSLRRGRISEGLYDLTDWLNTEIAARVAGVLAVSNGLSAHIAAATAHAASAISYGGSGNWADATAVTSSNVEAAIDEVVSDLAATAGGGRIGAATTGGTFRFGLAGATVQAQLNEIRGYLDLGPTGKRVSTITANTTLTTERKINANTSGGAFTITLPAPSNGLEFEVKDALGTWDTYALTIAPNGGEKIEGVAASRVFAGGWGAFRVYSDGTNWFLA